MTMPEVPRFFGISIRFTYNDHEPAHLHAVYGEYEALIEIDSLSVFRGELPRRALALVAVDEQGVRTARRSIGAYCASRLKNRECTNGVGQNLGCQATRQLRT